LDTKRGAEEFERVLRARLLQGEPVEGPERKEVPIVSTFLAEWVETYAKTNNKPSEAWSKSMIVRRHLVPFFGKMRLDEIGVRDVERFKAEQLRRELSAKSVNNHLTVLRRALACAVEWAIIEHVPRIQWLRTAVPEFDFLTREESDRLLAAVPREHLAIVATAVKAGLRRGELLALRWEDIDLRAGKILVRRSVWKGKVTSPKGGRSREVALSPKLAEALRGHRHLRGPIVFCNADGSMLTRDQIKRIVPTACRKAGLREIQWHVLRHSFASQLVMAGVTLRAVQELLGHATIEMTMRYAHLAPAVHREAVASLDRLQKSGHQMGTETETVV